MTNLFNLIWVVFVGWWSALLWLIVGGFFILTVVGRPIGRACLEFAKLNAFPYGKDIIRETELHGEDGVLEKRKVWSKILNIVWLPVGLLATVFYFVAGIFCFLTIIGIPVGVVLVRMGQFVLFPVGAKVVTKKQAQASAVANELARRQKQKEK